MTDVMTPQQFQAMDHDSAPHRFCATVRRIFSHGPIPPSIRLNDETSANAPFLHPRACPYRVDYS